MNYYERLQYIAHVDREDSFIDSIERWEAHKGLLHRAFTVALWHEDYLILQHRKHPVFDHVLDVTISSHQLFHNGQMEDSVDAVYRALLREWYLEKSDLLILPQHDGTIYYKAQDPRSEYIEHEVCHIYSTHIKNWKEPNRECAYGYTRISKKELYDNSRPHYASLAPWVVEMINKKLV